ncbi:MAG: antibiotic biosynthesis monooxygenase [Deltaproteobacteria bacterium]|nr:antibiotic biosynthesis monooxygenase [Deltaproteobacteria bacterium]MBN2672738.1 antibiotic biosynthesis monooxygenase [Deltaproteobacteria bacterium]
MAVKHITEFRASPENTQKMAEFLTSLIPYITSCEGNLGCDVMQSEIDPCHFLVVEHWESETAHEQSLKQLPPDILVRIQNVK